MYLGFKVHLLFKLLFLTLFWYLYLGARILWFFFIIFAAINHHESLSLSVPGRCLWRWILIQLWLIFQSVFGESISWPITGFIRVYCIIIYLLFRLLFCSFCTSGLFSLVYLPHLLTLVLLWLDRFCLSSLLGVESLSDWNLVTLDLSHRWFLLHC